MKVKVLSILAVAALLLIFLSQSLAQGNGSDLFELSKIQEGKKSLRISSYDKTGGNNDRFEHIKDGEVREIFNVEGAGYINHIWVTIAPPPEKMSRNDIFIRMYWDGNDYPAVESPIGPFFGQGWNESYDFISLPLAVGPTAGRAIVSYFIMPFSDGARIEIENQTGQEIRAFYYYVDYVKIKNLPENMGRFQAWYNHELTQAYTSEGGPANNLKGENNYLIADIKGKGHFVGVNYYVHSPTPIWYGEGDDMIFIDGDKTPTLNGTGTEDYFNTSWCPRSIYTHPYFGYARVNNDIGWLGRTHLYRFHINDPIYFDKSLKFTIEHGHNNDLTLDLASVAYWYQRPPLTKLKPIPGREERNPKPFINIGDIHKWRREWRKSKGNDAQLWGDEK